MTLAADANTVETATMWIAVAALAASLVAVGIAWWNGHSSRRSADAAEGSKNAADRSADAAKDSADAASRALRVDLERAHRELEPDRETATFVTEVNPRTDRECLFLVMTPARPYLVHADYVFDTGGRTPLSWRDSNVLATGVEAKVFVAEVADFKPGHVEIRFFPAPDQAGHEPWTCECGQPTAGDHADRGHWVMRKRWIPPQPPMVAWA